MKDIYSRIYDVETDKSKTSKNNIKATANGEVNYLVPMVIGIAGIIIAVFCLISLYFCFSYDLCLFLDSYFVYITGVCGIILLICIYYSAKSIKESFHFIALLNILLSLAALIIFIIPLITGLLYFNF